ncbi:hypothetical protein [Bradyrhizobium sp. sBnM-33]|uniref:hypothetical protein n=1 Tax=Bradyrhizobium sp. sBnM-33 TaxID=2831780 RepID=UPI001BCED92D|nr:hypothetical protein [Bradyrhizobium sp. sBnM-33]WOH54069.1 hypothetical protein RX328_19395 [Bradyrhizobium sp. sBnM-33]
MKRFAADPIFDEEDVALVAVIPGAGGEARQFFKFVDQAAPEAAFFAPLSEAFPSSPVPQRLA